MSEATQNQDPKPQSDEELAAAAAMTATDQLADAQAELTNLKAQNADLADQYLRAQAYVQNARRRADDEIAKARSRRRVAETYAKRFAAKEACAKALGTGVPRAGVHWKHLGVVNLPSGKPGFDLTGGAAARLARITPLGYKALVHLTLTDDHPWAEAHVIIEAVPLGSS